MQRTATIIACFLLLLFQSVVGQETSKVEEPERYGFFYYLNASNNSLLLLERQPPRTNTKKKAMGFGGFTVSVDIKGGRSPVRFTSDQQLVFFVRMFQGFDFAGVGGLTKAEVKNDKRVMNNTSVGREGRSSNAPFDPNPNAIPYKVEKYTNETFRILPARVLERGEYCFQGIGTVDFFCFGIDPAEQKN